MEQKSPQSVLEYSIKSSGIKREDIYVTSKLWLQDYGYEAAKKGIDTSLKNLNLDYMDLYLLHQPYFDTKGAWKALEEAVDEGKIKSIGISNHTIGFLEKLIPEMRIKPAINQMECNPLFQQKELREYMKPYDIKMQAWYPLGHGNKELFENSILKNIGCKYNKTVSQIILRWHIEEGVIPIPKSTSMNHIKENFDIFDFSLDSDDMIKIRSIDTGKGTHNPDDLSFGETLLNAYKNAKGQKMNSVFLHNGVHIEYPDQKGNNISVSGEILSTNPVATRTEIRNMTGATIKGSDFWIL